MRCPLSGRSFTRSGFRPIGAAGGRVPSSYSRFLDDASQTTRCLPEVTLVTLEATLRDAVTRPSTLEGDLLVRRAISL